MSDPVRAFVAIRVPPSPGLNEILAELGSLGRAVRPVAAENLHLTLKFLGDTDPDWLRDVGDILSGVGRRSAAFEVSLSGVGAFPSLSRPSVIWTGMAPEEPVIQLAAAVEAALVEYGFSAESRPFRAHVTLARIKRRPPRELADRLARRVQTELSRVLVDELVLMRSDLTPDGSRYTPLFMARIGGGTEVACPEIRPAG